ncbi:hypothetical protein [Microcoleus sp. herbarium12]
MLRQHLYALVFGKLCYIILERVGCKYRSAQWNAANRKQPDLNTVCQR